MTATITDQGTGTPTGGATGRVSRVIGPVIDAEFPANAMPEIYNALTTEIDLNGQRRTVTFEVAQHLGGALGVPPDHHTGAVGQGDHHRE